MDGWQCFDREYQALRNEKGEEEAKQALLVLTDLMIWLKTSPGRPWKATLSAINHRVSDKVKYQTIATVRE